MSKAMGISHARLSLVMGGRRNVTYADLKKLQAALPVSAGKAYHLDIDGPLLREQRMAILRLQRDLEQQPPQEVAQLLECLEGLTNMLDAIADQAHDVHGIDCIIPDEPEDT